MLLPAMYASTCNVHKTIALAVAVQILGVLSLDKLTTANKYKGNGQTEGMLFLVLHIY